MPRTSGTRRKGSGIPAGGAGWGGPARGTRAAFSAERQPSMRARIGAAERRVAEAATLREMLRPHLSAAAQTWLDVMLDEAAPAAARIAAAEKVAERVEGKVAERVALLDSRGAESLSDDELAAIALGGRAGAAPAADDPPEPDGVV